MAQDKEKKAVVVRRTPTTLSYAARQKMLKDAKNKINLPEQKMEVIFIPNRVAEASYDYSLFEEKTFNYILLAIQAAVRANMNGLDYRQLEMFTTGKDILSIEIPMNKITSPNQYNQLRKAILDMGKTEVHISKYEEKMHRTIYLFRGINTWSTQERSNTMTVEVSHEVAELLIEVDKNRMGRPMHYTSFLLNAANSFTNKYGSRIYKMISGWKEKGCFHMTLEELRKLLALGSRYPRYADIKKRILLPVQQEIEKNKKLFDCWYDCNADDFVIKKGRNVVALFFIVHTPGSEELKNRKVEYIKALLLEHFGLTTTHFEQLEEVFSSRFMNMERMMDEVERLGTYCTENHTKIKDKAAYVTEALLRMFAEKRRLSTEEEN